MSYQCGGTTACCYQHPSLPSLPCFPPPCVPCPKLKTQGMAKDFKLSKKPLLDMLEEDRVMKLRISMENLSHERKIHDNAKFKLKLALADAETDLENRRDKLKTLIENEQECFRHEIIGKFEAKSSSRIDEMREKVRKLRAEKEIQQKKVVEEKLNRVFESQCDEMRGLLSKRLSREIAEDWNEQVRMERRLQCEQQEEERMWAALNEEDMNEKLKREQVYEQRREEFSKKALEEMNKQIEFKKLKKANVAKIAEQERALIDADLAAAQAERKKQREEKVAKFQRAKEHVKDMLETRNYYRDRKLKREEIVAREFLKKAVRELYVEQEDRDKRKKDLMGAITIYRDYLRKWNCLENAREDALQRIIDGVIEEQHDKVMASRKREHDQRRQLFKNVLAGRKLQMEDLERKREFEAKEHQREMDALKEDWKVYLHEMEAEKAEKVKNNQQYKCDLDSQSAYNILLMEREAAELRRQDEMGEIEEKLFQNRLHTTLQNQELKSGNPYRLPLIGKDVRQCYCPVPVPARDIGNGC